MRTNPAVEQNKNIKMVCRADGLGYESACTLLSSTPTIAL